MASKTVHKGELWFQVLAGKSPKEQAIIYLITLTIPLWKSIHFLLWIAAQEQSAKESVLLWYFQLVHTRESYYFHWSRGSTYMWEVMQDCSMADKGYFPLTAVTGGTARPFLWRGNRVTQPCVLGGADCTSVLARAFTWVRHWHMADVFFPDHTNVLMALKTGLWNLASSCHSILGPVSDKFLLCI